MMVNLYDASGNIIAEFHDVIRWGHNFVEYRNGSLRAKMYCDPDAGEFLAEVTDEATEADYQSALSELGVTFDEEV